MTYSVLNAVFLGATLLFVVVAFSLMRRRQRDGERTSRLGLSYAFTLLIMVVTTAIFDNVIIGVGLVDYDPANLLGIYIGIAPIEDFSYTLAAVAILPTLWLLLGTRGSRK